MLFLFLYHVRHSYKFNSSTNFWVFYICLDSRIWRKFTCLFYFSIFSCNPTPFSHIGTWLGLGTKCKYRPYLLFVLQCSVVTYLCVSCSPVSNKLVITSFTWTLLTLRQIPLGYWRNNIVYHMLHSDVY